MLMIDRCMPTVHFMHIVLIPKGEEIKQIVIKILNSIGVLRKVCGIVFGVAERIWKNDSVKTLNGYWNALKQKWSLLWVMQWLERFGDPDR